MAGVNMTSKRAKSTSSCETFLVCGMLPTVLPTMPPSERFNVAVHLTMKFVYVLMVANVDDIKSHCDTTRQPFNCFHVS